MEKIKKDYDEYYSAKFCVTAAGKGLVLQRKVRE